MSYLNLAQNLTVKRIPAEVRGSGHYRLVIWEIDPDTNGRLVQDVLDLAEEMCLYVFNRRRAGWAAQGFNVSIEPLNF